MVLNDIVNQIGFVPNHHITKLRLRFNRRFPIFIVVITDSDADSSKNKIIRSVGC